MIIIFISYFYQCKHIFNILYLPALTASFTEPYIIDIVEKNNIYKININS